MAKQYFAAPASSAGVERVFSAAGKMHSDLQKSAKDSTLEHSLFAAFNIDSQRCGVLGSGLLMASVMGFRRLLDSINSLKTT